MMPSIRTRLAHLLDPQAAIDRDELAADVDTLAFERDELQGQITRLEERLAEVQGLCARLENRVGNQRSTFREEIARLLEPTEVGSCRKIRYLRQADAELHAAHLASKFPGEGYGAYPCRSCPTYSSPFQGWRPWHVGHRDMDEEAFWVDDEGLHRPGMPVTAPLTAPMPLGWRKAAHS